MEDEVVEVREDVQLDPKMQEAIEKKVADLKAKNPRRRIYPIVVEGDPDYDEKAVYVAYFTEPNFTSMSKFFTLSQKDYTLAMRALAKECFVDGDKELVDDDSLFLFGLMGQLNGIITARHGRLVNLSKPGK